MLAEELLTYLFDGQPHLLAPPMAAWLASSRRFTTFVTTYRSKIRKKLRTRPDPASLLDLQLELETAYLLLGQRPLNLAYEPQCEQPRCPDFAVTFTTSLTFMLEVTRLQAEQKNTLAASAPNTVPEGQFVDLRLADTICSKLGQLRPHYSNVLLIGLETFGLTHDDLRATMLHLQQRGEQSDEAFLRRYQLRSRAEFFRAYRRLSEVLVRGPDIETAESLTVWVNPQAKHALTSKVRTALYRSHAGKT
ncbi:MAG: hypothetical protein IPM53_27630 [Anaerolineaceae bacterium]|nr:hypothetical protein [Anaerolineaceae bacterium]